ncbi:unnamed protein product [Scytosiphon promiscuus]
MPLNKYVRRRILPTLTAAAAATMGVNAIEWGSTTSSTSDFLLSANVGEILELVIEPGARASIDFVGEPSDHFAVSYRQCTLEDQQPLQMQYEEKLQYMPFPGGCIYAENLEAEIGKSGCTFWQYNPAERYMMDGVIYEDSELLSPSRVRFENQGNGNATVEVAMFSAEIPAPMGLVHPVDVWIEDGYTKKDRVINTSVNVYFNQDGNYCDTYGCTVTGYVNDYVEGQDSLSLCQVRDNGTIYYDKEPFDTWIPLTFELPEEDDYYVTLVLSAKDTTKGATNYTELVEWGQEEIVVFQTDTTQPDNAARVLAGLSLMTITWVILFNTLFASLGASGAQQQHEAVVPTLGW